MNYLELCEAVKNGSIVGALNSSGKKIRFFISDDGSLCRFKPRSRRRGSRVFESELSGLKNFISTETPITDEERLKKEYRGIEKYRRMAALATFTNPFIRDCLALPDFEMWSRDVVQPNAWETNKEPRPKSLYELHIATGTSLDGKVISLNRIARKYPREIELLRQCISQKLARPIISGRWAKFAGYDISIETEFNSETGDFRGFLSLEYAGCGNGYYYLLINDDNFIGYDVD